jgi:membrane protein DedA with SNARE-associated domain
MVDSSLVSAWVNPGSDPRGGPLGIDAVLIVLAAKYRAIFWLFPPIVTAASLVAVGLTFWAGRTAGDAGLTRLVSPRFLQRAKQWLDKAGPASIAAAAVLPPPFPLTPFVLTCGALDVDRWRFFVVFGAMRLVRFSTVALLARQYGEAVLKGLESYQLQAAATLFVIIAIAVTIASAIVVYRRWPSIMSAGEPAEQT